MIFNKFKKRDSKNKMMKSSIIVDKSNKNGFGDKRKSKTFVETDMLRNKLATAHQSSMHSKLNNETDADHMNDNMLLSMKSINRISSGDKSKRSSTKAITNEVSNGVNSRQARQSDFNFEEESTDK